MFFYDEVKNDEVKNDTKCEDCSHNKTCEVKDDFLDFLNYSLVNEDTKLRTYVEFRRDDVGYGCMDFSQNVNVNNNRPGTCWGCPVGDPGVSGNTPEPVLGCETED